jgi:hypothetical protein
MQLRSIQAPLATAVRAAATFGMLLAMTGTARAAEQDFRGEVTPFAGYRFGGEFRVADSDRDLELEDSASFGMMLDLYARGGTSYQLHYSLQQTDARFDDPVEGTTSFDTTLHFLQFGGTYRGDGETFQPYLAATLGATHLRTAGAGGGSDTFPSGSIGAGGERATDPPVRHAPGRTRVRHADRLEHRAVLPYRPGSERLRDPGGGRTARAVRGLRRLHVPLLTSLCRRRPAG